ncbi:MAG: hypothetical protein H0V92_06770 [Pseudonocardiales bacterium]|nr:hypothetical protein [Pseudonocardiales bacterium]
MRGSSAIGIGAVCVLLGGLWFLQGIGMVGGSFMTGSRLWLFIGLVVMLGGLTLIAGALRARRNGRAD